MTTLFIKKIRDVEDIHYVKKGDAGFDLRASGHFIINMDTEKEDIYTVSYELQPGERILVKTGVEMHIPTGFWGNIRDRSGLAYKHGIHTLGGVIDETYRGEVCVILVNMGKNPYTIMKNERIAQMIIAPYVATEIEFVDELESTERGATGFGHSGKN